MLENSINFFSLFMVFVIQIYTFNCFPDKFSSNNGPIDFLNSFPNTNDKFQPSLSTTTGNSGTFAQPTFNFRQRNDFSQPTASASDCAVSSFQTSLPSTTPSSLETFISTFTNAVHTSPVLANLFELSRTSVQDYETFLYHNIRANMESLGISDPHELATYSSIPLTESFEILTYPMLVRIYANAMGNYLLDQRILNDANAAYLALAFANEMKISAKETVQKDYPRSKFQALSGGYVGFSKSQGLYTSEEIIVAARYFGDEIRRAGKLFGIGAQNYASTNV